MTREVKFFAGSEFGAAYSDLNSGIIYLNSLKWGVLGQLEREFVILHEQAHIDLQTMNETECDLFAFRELVRRGRNPRKIVDGFPNVVSMASADNVHRYKQLQKQLD